MPVFYLGCFSSFWNRREEGLPTATPWYVRGVEPKKIPSPHPHIITQQIYRKDTEYTTEIMFHNLTKEIVSSSNETEVARSPSKEQITSELESNGDESLMDNIDGTAIRQRRTGVFEIEMLNEPKIKEVMKNKDLDDSRLIPPTSSGYCSANSGGSDEEFDKGTSWLQQNLVRRCMSLDSAIPSDDDSTVLNSNWGEKREDIEDELPYQYPVFSPYSPRRSIDQQMVPSKTLIEAQCVPLPFDRKFSDCTSLGSDILSVSRRQSCVTDDGEEVPRYRYLRTPSVVVSDYSDDPVALNLDDFEYIRGKHQNENSSPESSLHSSLSNFFGNRLEAYRKNSDCSSCSTFSGDDDSDVSCQTQEPSPWRKIRNFVQWTPFFQTYKKNRYPWVQLAGHQGNFKAGPDQGTILKKLCPKEEVCFKALMNDDLRPFVPEYKGVIEGDDGESSYIQLQDLLSDFISPCVMDCKIGVRTYLEEELAKAKEKPKLRKDMYEKMCQIDDTAPTDEEHKLKGVTKPRYMVWRETISSTATMGFRIEGIRKSDGTSSKDFKTIKTKDQITKEFIDFTENFPHAVPKYVQRLQAIRAALVTSPFFKSHEFIGSSLLFVHDQYNASIWLIDFAKTMELPSDISITHSDKWKVGNHEDGYLTGLDNIISIFKSILENYPVPITPPLSLPDTPSLTPSEDIILPVNNLSSLNQTITSSVNT